MSQRKGFTLIELLVVIAIIAILAAILFPVFIQAKDKGRQTMCLSNTKQIGTSIVTYAGDFNDTYPAVKLCTGDDASTWQAYATIVDVLAKYNKSDNVWKCPTQKGSGIWVCSYTNAGYLAGTKYPQHYAWNSWVISPVGGWYTYDPAAIAAGYGKTKRMSSIRKPSGSVFGYCWRIIPGLEWFRDYMNYDEVASAADYAARNGKPTPFPHVDGTNYIFCDGHAKWFKLESLKRENFNPPLPN